MSYTESHLSPKYFLTNVDLLMFRPMEKGLGVDVGYLSKILFCSPVLGIAFHVIIMVLDYCGQEPKNITR